MNAQEKDGLVQLLRTRFEKNMDRHPGLDWNAVRAQLEGNATALRSLQAMESTGGEPDVVGAASADGRYVFCDCSAESPGGRRSLCYDRSAWTARKENRPGGNAEDVAAAMGVSILNEAEYRELQGLGEFDTKTSSWVATPEDVRSRGGALFCDRRYGRVFVYHNGAQSYYAARGFRCRLRV